MTTYWKANECALETEGADAATSAAIGLLPPHLAPAEDPNVHPFHLCLLALVVFASFFSTPLSPAQMTKKNPNKIRQKN